MINLQTPRLIFRQWQKNDFPYLADYFSKEENTTFLGGIKSQEAAWRLMASYIGHFQLNGYSYVALEEKDSGDLIGSVGLWNSAPWPELELGYYIFTNHQRKGFATEAAKAAKDFAFAQLNVSTLVSYIDADNQASKHVAKRLGGQFDQIIELLEYGPHEVFRYQ